MKHFLSYILLSALVLVACKPEARIPDSSTPVSEQADIYPDYRDIVVPPNIAPLNFQVKGDGKSYVAAIEGGGQQILAAAGSDGKLSFDIEEWHALLNAAKGKDLKVTLYAECEDGWVKHPAYSISVATEPIDRYLSYRLIEPSYELYRQLGIYQRDLTGFDETPIYENNSTFDNKDNHCINCHNYQGHDTERMLFHVRAMHGGTVFVDKGKVWKMDMKCDSILSSTVYPAWHPTKPWIVFSSNQTGQAFYLKDAQKTEVIDYGSDLVFYDVERNRLSNILKTDADMETFPAWSPDGKRLYYCVAHLAAFEHTPDTGMVRSDSVLAAYNAVRYNLMSMPFDERTHTFGQPEMELNAANLHMSATLPRVSPDGKYLLFTLGQFGQFHIWHKSSDLFVKNLQTQEIYALTEANSPDVESYHCWSSNGRWIVFSSRRDDGSYTRPYIAYFDKNGRAHKAFLLPQEDPELNLLRMKSYNIPELTRHPVKVSAEEFRKVIYDDAAARKVEYGK